MVIDVHHSFYVLKLKDITHIKRLEIVQNICSAVFYLLRHTYIVCDFFANTYHISISLPSSSISKQTYIRSRHHICRTRPLLNWRMILVINLSQVWHMTSLDKNIGLNAFMLLTKMDLKHIILSIWFKSVLETQAVECSMESFMHKNYGSKFIYICLQAVSWQFLCNRQSKS